MSNKLKWSDNPIGSKYFEKVAGSKKYNIIYYIVRDKNKHYAYGRCNGKNFFDGPAVNKTVEEFQELIERHFSNWLKENSSS